MPRVCRIECRIGRLGRRFFHLAPCTLFVLSLATPAAWGQGRKPEQFVRAIQAQDENHWEQSVTLLLAAIHGQEEDGKPARIYGTRYQSYLPHYYLGFAYYKLGRCADAIKEWEGSLKIGAVQRAPEISSLTKYRIECQHRLLALGQAGP